MWKWLGGCLLVVVVMVVGAMIWGYGAMRDSLAPDGSASVMIGAPPARVFASIAHGDSAATWMAQGSTVLASRHGPLVHGDTLRIEMRASIGVPQQAMIWTVKEVVPDRVLVLELQNDKKQGVIATRRDSVAAVGDSTRVVTRILSPMLDSMRTKGSTGKGKSADGLGGLAPDFLLSMFRMQSKLEQLRLKARIEGTPRR